MNKLWELAQKNAIKEYEEENGRYSWEDATKYEKQDYVAAEFEKLKEKEQEEIKKESKKENKVMTNKEIRMETLKANGVDTSKFFTVSVNAPIGAKVTITIDGVPYTVESNADNEVTSISGGEVTNKVVREIINKGYVFNRRTDGRWITAQTFKMLESEEGWNRYLAEHYGYMYQFEMTKDELHKLARMERDNDPEFDRLSRFFTKEVVVELCKQYIRQLKKYANNLAKYDYHKCNGVPYVKLNKYGDVFVRDLDKIYRLFEVLESHVEDANTYSELELCFIKFVKSMVKLPYGTPKCNQWKDAFKGKGAYVTLLNIIKFHGVTFNGMNTYDSVAYVEYKLDEYNGKLWKFHELLIEAIKENDFKLRY